MEQLGLGPRPSPARRRLALALISLSTSSCALLANLPAGGGIAPPSVGFQGATLARSPTQRQLEAYYCPDVVPSPMGVPGGASVLCRGLFGARPAPVDLAVAFDLRFKLSNPNQVPVPLADVLAAITVFPAGSNQSLGATCIHLCAPDQPGCTGQADPTACQASSRDIRSMADFAGATANLLVSAGVSAAAGQPMTFAAPRLAAGAELDVVVRYTFGPQELLGILRQVASQSANELKAGRAVTFNIPFRIEGTIWFDAGSFGRVPVGYGPFDGNWVLPTEGLSPRS
jgi:hypothetical protein